MNYSSAKLLILEMKTIRSLGVLYMLTELSWDCPYLSHMSRIFLNQKSFLRHYSKRRREKKKWDRKAGNYIGWLGILIVQRSPGKWVTVLVTAKIFSVLFCPDTCQAVACIPISSAAVGYHKICSAFCVVPCDLLKQCSVFAFKKGHCSAIQLSSIKQKRGETFLRT